MITLTKTRRIDWHQIVLDLRHRGMTFAQIASRIGVSKSAIHDYCDDRCIEPSYWIGSELLVLWSGVTGRGYTQAPTRTVQASVAAVLEGAG